MIQDHDHACHVRHALKLWQMIADGPNLLMSECAGHAAYTPGVGNDISVPKESALRLEILPSGPAKC